MNKLIIVLIAAFLMVSFSKGQTDSTKKVLAFVPQYLINKGIRIDYDIKLKNNQWLQLCPQVYLSENGQKYIFGEDYNEVSGIGIQIYHRFYLNKNYSTFGSYFSYGLAYNYFFINYDEKIDQVVSKENVNINKVGGEMLIGYQTVIIQRIIIDMYAGLGGRYSIYDYSGKSKPKYNFNYWSYGYTGNLLIAGLRLGITF